MLPGKAHADGKILLCRDRGKLDLVAEIARHIVKKHMHAGQIQRVFIFVIMIQQPFGKISAGADLVKGTSFIAVAGKFGESMGKNQRPAFLIFFDLLHRWFPLLQ